MARCPYAKLEDLENELDDIRNWEFIKEPKPGIFYLRSKPFMHFHTEDGKRWADVRSGLDWGPQIEIPFKASAKYGKTFLTRVEKCYLESLKAMRLGVRPNS